MTVLHTSNESSPESEELSKNVKKLVVLFRYFLPNKHKQTFNKHKIGKKYSCFTCFLI